MSDRHKILVVEDERGIRQGLLDVLVFHGFQPVGAEDGEVGLELGRDTDVALALLDVMLPGIDGFNVCKQLRAAKPDLPIIMLTAKGAEDDVLQGFTCGADDYVTKPFSVRELMARVEAMLRRTGRAKEELCDRFAFGDWQIDGDRLLASMGEHHVELTARELQILRLLSRDRDRIVSRRRLLQEVWGHDNAENLITRTVDMHIAKLRKKLHPSDSIKTVRGAGYRYAG